MTHNSAGLVVRRFFSFLLTKLTMLAVNLLFEIHFGGAWGIVGDLFFLGFDKIDCSVDVLYLFTSRVPLEVYLWLRHLLRGQNNVYSRHGPHRKSAQNSWWYKLTLGTSHWFSLHMPDSLNWSSRASPFCFSCWTHNFFTDKLGSFANHFCAAFAAT